MAEVKCEYCGHLIDDSIETCPFCSAPNPGFGRFSGDAARPRTIEELRQWYADRHLPPENITRFFIGRDVKEPKAFGIYKNENTGEFVVYKNKARGERAVRYSGRDEDYAVNELYLKLKETILDQKAHNMARRGGIAATGGTSRAGTVNTGFVSNMNYQAPPGSAPRSVKAPVTRKKKGLPKWAWIVIGIVAFIAVVAIFGITSENAKKKDNDYFAQSPTDIYYRREYAEVNEWWHLAGTKWSYWGDLEPGEVPEDWVTSDNSFEWLSRIEERYGVRIPQLSDCREYIDMHHPEPKSGYYTSGNDVYYYLSDYYGEKYGDGDRSGWYKYEDDTWSYYCDEDDKELLGEDLWYDAEEYHEWEISDFDEDLGVATLFEDTDVYHTYSDARSAYYDANSSYGDDDDGGNSNRNNDSGYDWNDNDSWDSDLGDWDSDW